MDNCLRSYIQYAFVITMFMPAGCKTVKNNSGNAHKTNEEKYFLNLEKTTGENRIVFIVFDMECTDSVNEEYRFIKKTVRYAAGRIKTSVQLPGNFEYGFLVAEIKDGKNLLQQSYKIQDPLNSVYETSDEKTGEMQKHIVHKKQAELVLRFNVNEESKYLYLSKKGVSGVNQIFYAEL